MTLSVAQASLSLFSQRDRSGRDGTTEPGATSASSSKHREGISIGQRFFTDAARKTGQHLEQWLTDAQESGLPEFETFVIGVQKDKDAVLAGLTLPWSNGPLEGHVNRLKLIKRSMYGRAEFDLLKSRVLHQSKKNQDRKNKKKKKQGQQISRWMKNGTTSQYTRTDINGVA